MIPDYKISPEKIESPVQNEEQKNSDRGSDCAYFEGDNIKSDEDEFGDFQKQELDSNGDLILHDEEFGIPINDDDDMVEDSYLQSQFDFMYGQGG